MDLSLLDRRQWHGGQILAFSGLDGGTDFFDGLTARTAFDAPAIDIKLPGNGRLTFPTPSRVQLAGDFFRLETEGGPVRAAFLDAYHLLVEGACEVSATGPEITVLSEGARHLVGSSAHFEAGKIGSDLEAAWQARSAWLCATPIPSDASPRTQRTLAKAFSLMKTQVYTPEGQIRHRFTTPDRWPHRAMWLWDSAFHAIGWRHLDPVLAREMIEAVLDIQQPGGFIAHANNPNRTSEVTQPPVLALAIQLVNAVDPQPEWIAEVYPKLCAYIEWDLANRDLDGGGLLEWQIDADPNCRSGESGMDNSSRFDSANRLDAVDFNAFLSNECQILAGFARNLGRMEEARRWEARHQDLNHLINRRLWSDTAQFYLDYDLDRQAQSPVMSSVGFLPLLCRAASPPQALALAQHLSNPATFGTAFRIASIAAQDKKNYQKDMWRGPVWVNVNWLVARGFAVSGLPEVADALEQETTAEIEAYCEQFSTLFEYFDDRREVDPPELLRKGSCAPQDSPYHQVIHDYGWTATLYVDLALARRGSKT